MFRRNKTSINIGRGVSIEDLNSAIRRIDIVDEDRIGHLECFGTTHIGKSKLIDQIIMPFR